MCDWLCPQVTYYVLQGLGDELTGVAPFHNHGVLDFFNQLGCSALQEALGAFRLGLSADTCKNMEVDTQWSRSLPQQMVNQHLPKNKWLSP